MTSSSHDTAWKASMTWDRRLHHNHPHLDYQYHDLIIVMTSRSHPMMTQLERLLWLEIVVFVKIFVIMIMTPSLIEKLKSCSALFTNCCGRFRCRWMWLCHPLAALAPPRVLSAISCKLISGTKAAISGLQPASKWFWDYNIIPGEENNATRSNKEKAENSKEGGMSKIAKEGGMSRTQSIQTFGFARV